MISAPSHYSAGVTPLHAAAYEGHNEICMFLLEKGANSTARTYVISTNDPKTATI
eukprot:gene22972-31278_t